MRDFERGCTGAWLALLMSSSLFGCDSGALAVPPRPSLASIDLPAPSTTGQMPLEQALSLRRSVREYQAGELSMNEIAQLFWSAQGVTTSWGGRTAPSAGALYPLETYVAARDGVYHYVPVGHRAELLSRDDARRALAEAGGNPPALQEAPAIFVITAVHARTAAKYGGRSERYVAIEVGHAAQNLLLQAVSLGLGAVPIGAFSEESVSQALGLSADEEPIYLIPVGHAPR